MFQCKRIIFTQKWWKCKRYNYFRADPQNSRHANNKNSHILVLGRDFIPGVNDTTMYAEAEYQINFTIPNKKSVLSLPNNCDNSYLFVDSLQQAKFKTGSSEIKQTLLTLGNISTEFSISNMVKTELYGNVYDFSVDYNQISNENI